MEKSIEAPSELHSDDVRNFVDFGKMVERNYGKFRIKVPEIA